MTGSVGAFCILVIACSSALVQAENFLDAGASRILNPEFIAEQLHGELRTLLGKSDTSGASRLQLLQDRIKPLFSAMPKGADGSLDQAAARYALHRFFSQQHGWHVRGLEAVGAEKWDDAAAADMLEDHIPGYVLHLFEQGHGGKIGLRELAVLAATLEDVVHSEAIEMLSTAYEAQGLSVDKGLDPGAEQKIVATYLMFKIMPNPKFASLTTKRLNQVIDRAPQFYTGWLDTLMFAQDLQGFLSHSELSRTNPFVDEPARTRDFTSVGRLVEGLGENYGKFQNLECQAMKNVLIDLSDGTGRVPFSRFYRAAFENRSQHYSESPDYLRHLGVLDETDPRKPSVIVTNYMYARSNCLKSSKLYSVCCIDECEALMANLERSIASPLADPQRIAELISAMPSDTVSAPRNLSTTMRRRLDEIATRHEGNIPLHGRLFAQWMHHAFPNECAYPHTTGTLASPLTPMEWLLAEPETKRPLKASKEEMQVFMDAAMESNSSALLEASLEHILWTEEEELAIPIRVAHPFGKASLWFRLAALVFAFISIGVGLVRMIGATPAFAHSDKLGKNGAWSLLPGHARNSDQHWV